MANKPLFSWLLLRDWGSVGASRPRVRRAVLSGDGSREAQADRGADDVLATDEIHYSGQPMRRQFRSASERQSGSSGLLAERSPGCKRERCRFASNAVVMSVASGSDEDRRYGRTVPCRRSRSNRCRSRPCAPQVWRLSGAAGGSNWRRGRV